MYVDLDLIHQPTTGALVPVSWGHGIRSNFDALWSPPRLLAVAGTLTISDDSETEITFDQIQSHSGEFFDQGQDSASTFSIPLDGLYAAHCSVTFTFTGLAANPTAIVALAKDLDTTPNYLMRTSGDIAALTFTTGGIASLSTGDSVSFTAYQKTGAAATITGNCSLVYLGGI